MEVSEAAAEDLARLIRTHSLPADTKQRVQRSLRPLERFPLLGAELGGRWRGFRFLLGPWRWMVMVYVYLDDEDRAVVLTIQDGRSARIGTPGSSRR
ncbi:MAG: type II toxin-antitoxin system RelE/ParE family toxin [Gaiellaceae bacterium]